MNAWTYDKLITSGATPDRIRSTVLRGRLRRLYRGLYAIPPEDRIDHLRALTLLLPAHVALSHQTAAELHGFGVLRSDLVHVVVPAGMPFPDIKGVATHQSVVAFTAVERCGLPCLTATRCAVDLARVSRRADALGVLDAALRSGTTSLDEILQELARHRGLRGVRQVRQLAPVADGRAECLQESHLRLLLLDARLPAPEPQLWIPDDAGNPRYRLDMGWRDQHVGAEYDGASHLDRDRMRNDRERHNWLETRGWRMRYFTDRDLYRRSGHIVTTMRAALLSPPSPLHPLTSPI
jgi:very-short-patch-repair endonuclease